MRGARVSGVFVWPFFSGWNSPGGGFNPLTRVPLPFRPKPRSHRAEQFTALAAPGNVCKIMEAFFLLPLLLLLPPHGWPPCVYNIRPHGDQG